MNFKYMPELEWSFGYPAALLLMLTICCSLYYFFRRASWL
jgi:magnesium transporter